MEKPSHLGADNYGECLDMILRDAKVVEAVMSLEWFIFNMKHFRLYFRGLLKVRHAKKRTQKDQLGAKDIFLKEHTTGRFKCWLSLTQSYKQLVMVSPGGNFWNRRKRWYESTHPLRLKKNCWGDVPQKGRIGDTKRGQEIAHRKLRRGPGARIYRNSAKEGFITQ